MFDTVSYLILDQDLFFSESLSTIVNNSTIVARQIVSLRPPMLNVEFHDTTVQKHADLIKQKCNQEVESSRADDKFFTPEFFQATKLCWEDQGAQSVFKRSNEFQLIDCAK